MTGTTPLSRNDTAWYRMDLPINLMVVNAIFRFEGPVTLAQVRAVLGEALGRYDRFRQRVDETRGRPRWVDCPDFDLTRHIVEETAPGDEASLRAQIERRITEPLDRAHPLWEMRLYQGTRGATLLVRIHHCIADGVALMQVMLDACERAEGAGREAPRSAPRRAWYWWALLPLSVTLWTLRFLWVNTWLVARPRDPATIYKGALTGAKRVAWTPALPLADIKATCASAGCKVNDLLMAAAAGALRRYAATRGQAVVGPGVRAVVPVNMRPAKAARDLGNQFALVSPTLPIGTHAQDERLRLVKRRMDRLKGSPEPLSTSLFLKLLGLIGRRLQHPVQRFLLDKTTLVMTNVPGPRKKLSLGGAPIADVMFWVPMFGPIGLGLSIFSYADDVRLGVLSDEALVSDPQALADAFVLELQELEAHYGVTCAPTPAEAHRDAA
ncbi:MAG: DUF1298 domain-containing protein [Deltaproteobacteria bacterium]|nr:DUF1298 domain-containing protein [Deltaproteobacteria bacterium]